MKTFNDYTEAASTAYIFELQVMVRDTPVAILHVTAENFEEAQHRADAAIKVVQADRLLPVVILDIEKR